MFSSYTDSPGLRGLAGSGGYGAMPNDLYLKKLQHSSMKEDPNQFEKHMRSLLSDFAPDAPFFASDDPHDTHSKERISMRYSGARTDEDPYLPDGTFLDWEFTQRDPRSMMPGPDMRQHRNQQFARADFIKFYSDADNSVPESGISPAKMVKNVRSTQGEFARRFLNFDESFDGRETSKQAEFTQVHNRNKVDDDTIMLNLTDAVYRNRPDAVTQLSNDHTIAYRHSTPDHRVKIAHYGHVRSAVNPLLTDITKNRDGSRLDHARMAMIDGQMVNKTLVNLIVDMEGRRANKQEVAKGLNYGDSDMRRNKIAVIPAADLMAIMQLSVISQTVCPNTLHDGKRVNRHNLKPSEDYRPIMGQVQINHDLAESIANITKNIGRRKMVQEIRDKVLESAYDQGIYYQNANKMSGFRPRSENTKRNVDYDRYIEDSKKTVNYSNIAPTQSDIMTKLDNTPHGDESLNTIEKKLRFDKAMTTADDHEYDMSMDMNSFRLYDKANKIDPQRSKELSPGLKNFGSDISELPTDVTVNDL